MLIKQAKGKHNATKRQLFCLGVKFVCGRWALCAHNPQRNEINWRSKLHQSIPFLCWFIRLGSANSINSTFLFFLFSLFIAEHWLAGQPITHNKREEEKKDFIDSLAAPFHFFLNLFIQSSISFTNGKKGIVGSIGLARLLLWLVACRRLAAYNQPNSKTNPAQSPLLSAGNETIHSSKTNFHFVFSSFIHSFLWAAKPLTQFNSTVFSHSQREKKELNGCVGR